MKTSKTRTAEEVVAGTVDVAKDLIWDNSNQSATTSLPGNQAGYEVEDELYKFAMQCEYDQ